MNGKFFKLTDAERKPDFRLSGTPAPVLIAGGAAIGNPAAEMPCREGSPADATIPGAGAEPPCDRPALLIGVVAAECSKLRVL